jgi:hypothetical protein
LKVRCRVTSFVKLVLAELSKNLENLLVLGLKDFVITHSVLVLKTEVEELLGNCLKLVGNELGLGRA